MNFRKSTKSDVDEIMEIISEAQEYFKNEDIDQWQNNYPNENVINNDIKNNESYVLEIEGKAAATTVISFEKEKTYDKIYEGQWILKDKYAVIHRIAVSSKYKGLGLFNKIIEYAEKMCIERDIKSIKADTHRNNISMQKALKKSNFKYCGIIYLKDGSERIAFEKIINDTLN